MKKCPNCQTDNPEQAKFCLECGERLDSALPIATTNQASAKNGSLTVGGNAQGNMMLVAGQGSRIVVSSVALTQEQMEEVINRVVAKVQVILTESQNKSPDDSYQPPKLSDRMIYTYEVRHDIEKRIRWLVLSVGGGWAGCSMAHFDTYFDLATSFKLISENLSNEIKDLYNYTIFLINSEDVSAIEFLQLQIYAANIDRQLTSTIKKHFADGDLRNLQG